MDIYNNTCDNNINEIQLFKFKTPDDVYEYYNKLDPMPDIIIPEDHDIHDVIVTTICNMPREANKFNDLYNLLKPYIELQIEIPLYHEKLLEEHSKEYIETKYEDLWDLLLVYYISYLEKQKKFDHCEKIIYALDSILNLKICCKLISKRLLENSYKEPSEKILNYYKQQKILFELKRDKEVHHKFDWNTIKDMCNSITNDINRSFALKTYYYLPLSQQDDSDKEKLIETLDELQEHDQKRVITSLINNLIKNYKFDLVDKYLVLIDRSNLSKNMLLYDYAVALGIKNQFEKMLFILKEINKKPLEIEMYNCCLEFIDKDCIEAVKYILDNMDLHNYSFYIVHVTRYLIIHKKIHLLKKLDSNYSFLNNAKIESKNNFCIDLAFSLGIQGEFEDMMLILEKADKQYSDPKFDCGLKLFLHGYNLASKHILDSLNEIKSKDYEDRWTKTKNRERSVFDKIQDDMRRKILGNMDDSDSDDSD